jgi:hypothetical protein
LNCGINSEAGPLAVNDQVPADAHAELLPTEKSFNPSLPNESGAKKKVIAKTMIIVFDKTPEI